jgi:hypothetical protein
MDLHTISLTCNHLTIPLALIGIRDMITLQEVDHISIGTELGYQCALPINNSPIQLNDVLAMAQHIPLTNGEGTFLWNLD